MNIRFGSRLLPVAAAVTLGAFGGCGGSPPPEAPTPVRTDAVDSGAVGADSVAVPAPSIDPRPRHLSVAALPEPGVELRGLEEREGIDVLHYDLAIDLRGLADSLVRGHATLTVRVEPARERLDLDFVGLRVDSVRVDGVRTRFVQGPALLGVVPDSGFDGPAEIDVFFHGTPRDGLFIRPDPTGGLTAFADNWPNRARWWFPANDYPSDKATVEFAVRAPPGYEVVANGVPLGHEDGVWRWSTEVAIPTYTMVIGVADFERAALGKAACGAEPAAPAHNPSEGPACVDVTLWALAGGGAYGERRFEHAPDMVDFYSEMFGPYPYAKLAHVQSSTRFGGMENSSAIFYAMSGWAEKDMGESVIAHETVHQWFGDSVTPAAWSHLWVSEGFATYFAAVYFGERDGEEAFRDAMESARQAVIGSDASSRPVVDERNDLFGLLNTNSYQKGAWILHMLRSMLGDEAFFAAIRDYYAEHAGGVVGTEDVRRAMEEASAEDLGWFFEQWAYSPGFPRLEVTTRETGDGTIVTIDQVQDASWPTFRLPLVIELRTSAGTSERREILMKGRREILRFPPMAGDAEVIIDPGGTLLMEVAGP